MSDPARRSKELRFRHAGPDVGQWQASPDDQILPQRSRAGRRMRRVLTWSTLALLVVAGLWNAPDDRFRDPVWLMSSVTSKAAAIAGSLTSLKVAWPGSARSEGQVQGADRQPASQTQRNALDLASGGTSADAKSIDSIEPVVALPLAPAEVAGAPVGGHLAVYAPPPAEPADPLRARAEGVGLHPGISRAFLMRLTTADFQNAAVAIRTALAETADDGSYLWPRQRAPDLAVFEIHFVPGAPSGCRRYVVTITKDRWSATAPPMEKCGISPPRAKG
jgi:hypothetical protein